MYSPLFLNYRKYTTNTDIRPPIENYRATKQSTKEGMKTNTVTNAVVLAERETKATGDKWRRTTTSKR
jgi:hypothetical protein